METAAKTNTVQPRAVAQTAKGGKSLPAVPILQQKPKDLPEQPMPEMMAMAPPAGKRFSLPAVPVLPRSGSAPAQFVTQKAKLHGEGTLQKNATAPTSRFRTDISPENSNKSHGWGNPGQVIQLRKPTSDQFSILKTAIMENKKKTFKEKFRSIDPGKDEWISCELTFDKAKSWNTSRPAMADELIKESADLRFPTSHMAHYVDIGNGMFSQVVHPTADETVAYGAPKNAKGNYRWINHTTFDIARRNYVAQGDDVQSMVDRAIEFSTRVWAQPPFAQNGKLTPAPDNASIDAHEKREENKKKHSYYKNLSNKGQFTQAHNNNWTPEATAKEFTRPSLERQISKIRLISTPSSSVAGTPSGGASSSSVNLVSPTQTPDTTQDPISTGSSPTSTSSLSSVPMSDSQNGTVAGLAPQTSGTAQDLSPGNGTSMSPSSSSSEITSDNSRVVAGALLIEITALTQSQTDMNKIINYAYLYNKIIDKWESLTEEDFNSLWASFCSIDTSSFSEFLAPHQNSDVPLNEAASSTSAASALPSNEGKHQHKKQLGSNLASVTTAASDEDNSQVDLKHTKKASKTRPSDATSSSSEVHMDD
jgi:hypothetical protein